MDTKIMATKLFPVTDRTVLFPTSEIELLVPSAWYESRNSKTLISQRVYFRIKRLLDLLLCFLAIPFVIPLLAICALAIVIDSPGPVYFFQWRTGRGGRRFRMFKLRTMVRNAEELKAQLLHMNSLTYPDFKIANDPRITTVGRWLRRTSLDELPQIFNIIGGEMTLVGPRPTSFSAGSYSLWHTARLNATPGLTGLWQISGRNELDFDDRLRLDIAYLRNQSLWLDIRILFRTFGAVFTGKGAN
jgi:lipopolysaccharide/colanic/teichoic acid biosynthesis glycosyltransferase